MVPYSQSIALRIFAPRYSRLGAAVRQRNWRGDCAGNLDKSELVVGIFSKIPDEADAPKGREGHKQ